MSTVRDNGSLYTSIQNKVATVEFGHPASNSFTSELLERLTKELYALGENSEVSVIVLKSEGERAFCAGASFDELVAISNLEEGKAFFSGFANVINAMRKCPKLIIGRVQGKAVGGGVGLASSVDYCFATKHSSVKLSELAVGIGPFVVGPAVVGGVGHGWAEDHFCTHPGHFPHCFREPLVVADVYANTSRARHLEHKWLGSR